MIPQVSSLHLGAQIVVVIIIIIIINNNNNNNKFPNLYLYLTLKPSKYCKRQSSQQQETRYDRSTTNVDTGPVSD